MNRFCLFIVMDVLVIKKCPLSSSTYLLHMMRSVKMFMHLTSLCIKKKFHKENPVGFPQCKNLVGILHRFASFRMLLEGL